MLGGNLPPTLLAQPPADDLPADMQDGQFCMSLDNDVRLTAAARRSTAPCERFS